MWLFVWPYPYVASAVLASCTVLITTALLFYIHRKRQFRFFKLQKIPGPEPTSLFFGNVADTLAKGPTVTAYEWGLVHGQTYGYFEGPLPVLVSSDLDLLQQILVKQFHYFHGRKLYPVQPKDTDRENSFLVVADGQNWKRVRTIVNPTFTTLKMKQIAPLINSCINTLMEILSDQAEMNSSTEIYSCFSNFTMDVIASTAFGLDIDCQRKDSTFKTKCKQVMEHFSSFDFLDVVSVAFSEWRPFWTWWGFCRTLNNPHPFEWVKARAGELIKLRQEDQSTRRMDLMQIMLNTSVVSNDQRISSSSCSEDENGDQKRKLSPNLEKTAETVRSGLRNRSVASDENGAEKRVGTENSPDPLSLNELRANIAMFMVVGFDTTSAMMSYVAYDLSLNPDVQQKLYSEIESELGEKEELTYDDVHKLSYLDMVVKETLRMHPVVSNDVFCRRCSVSEVEVNGIKFVKDMVVKPEVVGIHFNQQIWGPEDVKNYYPERHAPELQEKRHPLSYMPFGFGPRLCIGMRYALLVVKLAFARTIRQYELTKTDDTVPLVTKEDGTIIPRGVNLALRKRKSGTCSED